MIQPRALVRQALRSVQLQRISHPSFVDFMLHERIKTVLDVGANEGHFGAELRERGYSGRIVSFEPISAVFAVLDSRAASDPTWDAHRLGVGNHDRDLEISVSTESVFSSFKSPSDYTAGKFVGIKEDHREIVPVVRLDTFLGDRPELLPDCYLKIDTQGFEKEVLEGAGAALALCQAVQLELPLRPLYEGQDTMIEMITWMSERGFEIAMAKENGFDWQAMRLLELDVVFVRVS